MSEPRVSIEGLIRPTGEKFDIHLYYHNNQPYIEVFQYCQSTDHKEPYVNRPAFGFEDLLILNYKKQDPLS